jgi:hypothetical protein
MQQSEIKIVWEPVAFKKYEEMITKIPHFHRDIAKQVVNKRAEQNALERKASMVEEGDIIRAFFSEVPVTFYSLMVRLMEDVKFSYKQYELPG